MTAANGHTNGHSHGTSTPTSSEHFLKEHTVTIVGCPFSGGQRRTGVDGGPNQLVEAGLVGQLEELGWNVEFEGHAQFDAICKQFEGKDREWP